MDDLIRTIEGPKNLRRGVHFAYTRLRRYKMWRLADRNVHTCVKRAQMAHIVDAHLPAIFKSRIYHYDYRCGRHSPIYASRHGNVPKLLGFSAWYMKLLADQYVS